MINAFSQLASVSAVLGGFAFVFLGALISAEDRTPPKMLTAALATPSAACFILSALGWSLVSVWLGSRPETPVRELPTFIQEIHVFLSPVFLLGILFFFASLGACGWIHSRRLGWLTRAVAALATIGAVVVLRPFLVEF